MPYISLDFPGGSEGKVSMCNAGDPGSIPGSERSPGERNGNPLQYSCLENPLDGAAWQARVHGVTKSWTRLSFTLYILYCCQMVQLSLKLASVLPAAIQVCNV